MNNDESSPGPPVEQEGSGTETLTNKKENEFLATWTGPEGEEEAGPLEVLWHLIESYRIDIFNVSLDRITGDFLNYMERSRELRLETASTFTVMSSKLLFYKSKALLPDPGFDDAEPEPRLPPELIQQLLEYRKFQIASEKMRDIEEEASGMLTRKTGLQHKKSITQNEDDWIDVSLIDLVRAYAGVLEKFEKVTEDSFELEYEQEEYSVDEKMQYIRSLLIEAISFAFLDLFLDLEKMNRIEIITTFLAVLEMTREGEIVVRQKDTFGELVIFKKSAVVR